MEIEGIEGKNWIIFRMGGWMDLTIRASLIRAPLGGAVVVLFGTSLSRLEGE